MSNPKIILFLSCILLLNLCSANMNLFPRDLALANQNVEYEFNISNEIGCNSTLVSSGPLVIKLDKSGVGFYSFDISALNGTIPQYLCVMKDHSYLTGSPFNFSDIVFNSIRVNQIYAQNITAQNIRSNSANFSGDIYINNGSSLTNTFLNLSGTNADRSIDIGINNFSMGENLTFSSSGAGKGSITWQAGQTWLLNHGLYVGGSVNPFLDVLGNIFAHNDIVIDQDLNVSRNSYFGGNLTPLNTLSQDIGSGSNRWNWLYVRNISSEYVDNSYTITTDKLMANSFNVTTINATMINVVSFNVTTINASYIYNPFFSGYMDLRGEPWFIGGTNLQIEKNLIVNGNISASTGFFSFLGDLLTRVQKIFVQDIDFNGTINGSGDIITMGNITTTNGYFEGQPLDGGMGSGIIWAEAFDKYANLNLSYSGAGLEINYSAFIMRLVNITNDVRYCSIPAGSVTVINNQESVYYVDNDCNVQSTDQNTYLSRVINPGGVYDFMTIVAHSGNIELNEGVTLGNKLSVKLRSSNIYMNNLQVKDGFQQYITPGKNITILTGRYMFDVDLRNWSTQNTTAGQKIEIGYLTGGVWAFNNFAVGINDSSCISGGDTITCTNPNRYRRTFIFAVSFKDGTDLSEIFQVLPLEGTSYPNLANCMDTTTYPLTYDLPSEYKNVAVPLYAYCGQASATSLINGQIIDLRTAKSGTSSSGVLGNYLTTDGTTKLTNNWNVGNWNITNISSAQGSIANFTTIYANNINISTWVLNISKNWTQQAFTNWNSTWDNNWLTTMLSANDTLINSSIFTYINGRVTALNTTANIGTLYNATASMIANTSITQYNITMQVNAPFNKSGTNVYLNNPADNVGIGTGSPSAKFNVVDTNGGFFFNGAGATYNRFKSTTTDVAVGRDLLFSAQDSGTTPDLYIKSTGNVGIGTAIPSQKLEVAGNLNVSGSREITLNPTTGIVNLKASTGGWAMGYTLSGSSGTDKGGYGFAGNGDTLSYYWLGPSYTSPYMTLLSGGNVGIGTTTPSNTLDVRGQGNFSSGIYFNNNTLAIGNVTASMIANLSILQYNVTIFQNSPFNKSGTNVFLNNPADKVGIGTTSPSSKLHVIGTAVPNPYYDSYSASTGILEFDDARLQLISANTGSGGSSIVLTNAPASGDNTNWIINHVGTTLGEGLLFRYSNTTATGQDSYTAAGFVNSLYLKENGNVGIGTTNPSALLEVSGVDSDGFGLKVKSTTGADTGILIGRNSTAINNSAGIVMRTATADYLGFFVNGSHTNPSFSQTAQMVLTENGNVGIGTTSPLNDLQIQNYGEVNVSISTNTAVANASLYLTEGAEATPNANGAQLYYDGSANYFSVATGTSTLIDRLTILRDTGNVGIGTTSPDFHLQVEGTGNQYVALNTLTPIGDVGLYAEEDGVAQFVLFSDTSDSKLRLANYRAEPIEFSTDRGGTENVAMTILDSGNVGIGVATPDTKLELYNATGSNLIHFRDGSDDAYVGWDASRNFMIKADDSRPIIFNTTTAGTAMTILDSGNVGIGTTNPTGKLEVSDTTNPTIYINATGNVDPSIFLFNGTGTARGGMMYDISDDAFELGYTGTGAFNQLVLKSTGNVGIGTATPQYALDINTTGTGTGIRLGARTLTSAYIVARDDGTSTNYRNLIIGANDIDLITATTGEGGSSASRLYIQNTSGNVGIGTTAPNAKLQINSPTNLYPTSATPSVSLRQSSNPLYGWDWIQDDQATGNLYLHRVENSVSTNVMTFLRASGNVGIGTTAPVSKLEIVSPTVDPMVAGSQVGGFALINADSKQYGLFGGVASTGNAWLQTGRNNAVTYYNLLLNANGGNVGIGTTSPESRLQISGGDNADVNLSVGSSDAWGEPVIGFDVSSTNYLSLGFSEGTSSAGTNVLRALNIQRAGNVGIGTTTPNDYLTIKGATVGAGNISLGALYATTYSSIYMNGLTGTGNYNLLSGYTDQDLYINRPTGKDINIRENDADQVIIKGTTGNVGIGTTTPVNQLDINGSVGTKLGFRRTGGYDNWAFYQTDPTGSNKGFGLYDENATAYRWFVDQTSGYVGIGTTTPSQTLDVRGQGNFSSGIYFNNNTLVIGNVTASMIANLSILQYNVTIFQNSPFNKSGTNVYLNNPADNVGIKTNSPETALQVYGTILTSTGDNSFKHYYDVASTPSGMSLTSSVVGTMKITMPRNWSDDMMVVKITGYQYAPNMGAWELTISGYDYATTPAWRNYKATLTGRAPFNQVRLGNNGSNDVILLGTTTTTWAYPQIMVTDFITGFIPATGWGTGWNITNITDETGIGQIVTPILDTYIDTSGRMGINTTSPAYLLEIAKSATALNVSGNLYVNSSNVGIGTTSPTHTLNVVGNTNFTGNLTITGGDISPNSNGIGNIIIDGNGYFGYVALNATAMYLGHNSDVRKLIFQTNENDRMTIDATGNVGIGTTAPTNMLDIGSAATGASIGLSGKTGTSNSYNINTTSGNYLIIQPTVAGSTPLVMDSTGDIGIGTTSPNYRFAVSNNSAEGIEFDVTGVMGAGSVGLIGYDRLHTIYNPINFKAENFTFLTEHVANALTILGASGNVGIGTTNPNVKLQSNIATAGFPVTSGATQTYGNLRLSSTDSNGVLDMGVKGTEGGWLQTTNAANLALTYPLLLNPNGGNVGIGTTAPTAKLDVNSAGALYSGSPSLLIQDGTGRATLVMNSSTSTDTPTDVLFKTGGLYGWDISLRGNTTDNRSLFFYPGNDAGTALNSPTFALLRGGYVGIGTTTPQAKLDVAGSVNITGSGSGLNFISGNNRIYFNGNRAMEGGTDGILLQVGEGYSITRMYGKVGIGTSTPVSTLNVDGNFSMTMANGENSTLGTLFVNNTNVGIGTTAPLEKLEVRSAAVIPIDSFLPKNWTDVSPNLYLQSSTNAIGAGGVLGFGGRDSTATDYAVWRIRSVFHTAGSGWGSNVALLFDVASDSARTTGTNLTNVLALKGDGKVGIGTATPSKTLDVRGQGNFSSGIYFNNNTLVIGNVTASMIANLSISQMSLGTGDFKFTDFHSSFVLNSTILNNTKNMGVLYNVTASMIGNLSAGQYQAVTNASMTNYNLTMYNYVNANNLSNFNLATAVNNTAKLVYAVNTTANIQVLLNGTNVWFNRVGVGTSTPAYLLEIAKSATALNVSGNLYVNSSNVGIGKFSPLYSLDVLGSANISQTIYVNRTDYVGGGYIYSNSTTLILGHI